MRQNGQEFWQWLMLAIAIAIPLVIGTQELFRLQSPFDLISGVGSGLVVMLCVVVLVLLGVVFLVAWLCKQCRRSAE